MKSNNKLIRPLLSIVAGVVLVLFCCIFIGNKKESKPESTNITSDYWYKTAEIDGHAYIIVGIVGQRSAGVTHSESCPCKKGLK